MGLLLNRESCHFQMCLEINPPGPPPEKKNICKHKIFCFSSILYKKMKSKIKQKHKMLEQTAKLRATCWQKIQSNHCLLQNASILAKPHFWGVQAVLPEAFEPAASCNGG